MFSRKKPSLFCQPSLEEEVIEGEGKEEACGSFTDISFHWVTKAQCR